MKRLKQTLLLSSAILALGLATVTSVAANDTTPSSSQVQQRPSSPSYQELVQAVEANTSLTAQERTTALQALESSKSDLERLTAIDEELIKLYDQSFSRLNADYRKVQSANQALWTKFYGNDWERLDEQEDSLGDWDRQDLLEARTRLAASTRLTSQEKSQLTKDLDQIEDLMGKWATASQTHTRQANALRTEAYQLQTKLAQNVNLTRTGIWYGYGLGDDWDDRYDRDWDDQFDWDDRFELNLPWDQDGDDWDDDDRYDWD